MTVGVFPLEPSLEDGSSLFAIGRDPSNGEQSELPTDEGLLVSVRVSRVSELIRNGPTSPLEDFKKCPWRIEGAVTGHNVTIIIGVGKSRQPANRGLGLKDGDRLSPSHITLNRSCALRCELQTRPELTGRLTALVFRFVAPIASNSTTVIARPYFSGGRTRFEILVSSSPSRTARRLCFQF